MIRIAICDDNRPFLEYEKKIVDDYLEGNRIDYVCDIYESGNALLADEARVKDYDLIVLDYQMDGLTGFDTAQRINKLCSNVAIAFATNFYDFTREGYKYRAVRYLVKQEKTFASEFCECIEYVLSHKSINEDIVLNLYDSSITVKIDDLIYIKSDDHYVKYCIKDKDTDTDHLIRRCSLDEAGKELPERFIRIHVRYIVNDKYAMRIHNGKMDVRISDDEMISLPIARNKADAVYKKFCLLKGAVL